MAQAKLLSMTIGLTLLIWVSADQLLKETDELLVNIKPIAAGPPDMSVVPVAGRLEPFKVKVLGPRKLIARRRVGGVIDIRLPVSDRPTGQHPIDLKSQLQPLPAAFEGLSIVDVEPPVLEVIVDHTTRVTMPVRVDPGTLDYALKPTVTPSDVDVTVSEWSLRKLPPERQHLTLYVEPILKGYAEGASFDRQVRLDPAVGGVEVTVQPPTVRLLAKLQEHRKTISVPAVPIRFEASPAIFNRYLIDRRDNLTLLAQPITVRGPADMIDQVEAGTVKLSGVIVLTWQDVDRAGTFRHVTPTFHLPPGVELVDEAASVEFRLVPIKPSPGAGTAPQGR